MATDTHPIRKDTTMSGSHLQPVAVKVVLEPADPQSYRDQPSWVATPIWPSVVDRTITGSISFGNSKTAEKTARRYAAAVMAGVVMYDLKVLTDIHGNTYVGHSSRVMGKYANADLKRLGF